MVAGSTREYQDFCLISDEIRLWFVVKLRRYRSYAASHLPEPSDGLDDGDCQRNDSFDVLRMRLLVDSKDIPTVEVSAGLLLANCCFDNLCWSADLIDEKITKDCGSY